VPDVVKSHLISPDVLLAELDPITSTYHASHAVAVKENQVTVARVALFVTVKSEASLEK
jgi:hypothetical protein